MLRGQAAIAGLSMATKSLATTWAIRGRYAYTKAPPSCLEQHKGQILGRGWATTF